MSGKIIREALLRRPFRPFMLVLADGREFPVSHPDFVTVTGERTCIVNHRDERWSVVNLLLVCTIEYEVPDEPVHSDGESP